MHKMLAGILPISDLRIAKWCGADGFNPLTVENLSAIRSVCRTVLEKMF